MQSLSNALNQQLERAKVLKTQRPVPGASSSAPEEKAPATASGGGVDPTSLIEKYKDRPELQALKDRPDFREKLDKLKGEKGQEIMKILDKYRNQ